MIMNAGKSGMEWKVRVVVVAALKMWMEKRTEQSQWLEECLEEA